MSGIILNNQRMLLLQRANSDKNNPGKWDLPGGRVRFGESPEHAIVREIEEETSIRAFDPQPFGIANYVRNTKTKRIQTVQIIFLINTEGPYEIKLKRLEHQAYLWVDNPKLSVMDLVFRDKIASILAKAITLAKTTQQ